MQHLSLLAFDKERCKPFFDRLTDLFHEHHHSADQDAEGYEVLLYKVHRPYTNGMLVTPAITFGRLLGSALANRS